MDAEEWLEEWVEENIQNHEFAEEAGDMQAKADACLKDARDAGVEPDELIEAAGGDLEAYLRKQQNAFTTAHIKRSTDKD